MNYLCLYVKLHSPKACAITGDFQNIPRAHKKLRNAPDITPTFIFPNWAHCSKINRSAFVYDITIPYALIHDILAQPEGVLQRGENEICLDALVIVHRHAG